MTILSIALWIGASGILLYGWGFYRGFQNWDDWALSMVIKNAGFTVIIVSLVLLIVWWVKP